jgi:hypothetical protein
LGYAGVSSTSALLVRNTQENHAEFAGHVTWSTASETRYRILKMTRRRIRRGVFCSVIDLQAAISAYLAEHNANPKPFVWTKFAEAILAKLDHCPVPSV